MFRNLVEIGPSFSNLRTTLTFGEYDRLAVSIGTGKLESSSVTALVATVMDKRCGVSFTTIGEDARRLSQCASLAEAEETWHQILMARLLERPALFFRILANIEAQAYEEGREDKADEIRTALLL